MPAIWGIVYSVGNVIIRRHIYSDDSEEINNPAHIYPGEAMVTFPHDETHTPEQWHATAESLVVQAAGKPLGNPRCHVINSTTNIVENTIMADPDLDAPAGTTHYMVNTIEANIGDHYDPTTKVLTRTFPSSKVAVV